MTNGKIRLLLADDHSVLRSGLRLLLSGQPDLDVVAEAADGWQTLHDSITLTCSSWT